MYSILNTLSEYIYFCISENITSYTSLQVCKIVENLQCIVNSIANKWKVLNMYLNLITLLFSFFQNIYIVVSLTGLLMVIIKYFSKRKCPEKWAILCESCKISE